MDRDLKAVEEVGRYRFLTTQQLLQLNWPKPSQRRHGESRLRELFHAGWLDRQPFGRGLGHPVAVYSLGPLGRLHTAGTAGMSVSRVGPRPVRERNHDLLFLQHHLKTVQVVINMTYAAERHGGSRVLYREERLLRSDWARDPKETRVVPDAFLVLAIGARTAAFCIELDRATVDAAAWQKKITDYIRWTRTEKYRTTLSNPAVLVVVDASSQLAQRRVRELKQVVDSEAARQHADPSFFWLTTMEETRPEAVLDKPVWLLGGQDGLHAIGGAQSA